MSEAFDYQDMHHLVDRLTPAQVRRLRLIISQDEELAQVAEEVQDSEEAEEGGLPESFLALIGSVSSGRGDMAENHDDYIRERMRQRRERWA
ncbi:hypothetical protein [Streptacidiphilus monticola]|uniref:Uncharacterized protein n=1 Tax=Streptacidiphilus monticola TaxID=2161674 RepID=A0ABW1G427_9ACTN